MTEWTPPPPRGIAGAQERAGALLVVSRPEGLSAHWEGQQPGAELRAIVAGRATSLSSQVAPGPHATTGYTFLRLTIRPIPTESPIPPDHEVTSDSSYGIDYQIGSGGAPSDHPRLPAEALFAHAATEANR